MALNDRRSLGRRDLSGGRTGFLLLGLRWSLLALLLLAFSGPLRPLECLDQQVTVQQIGVQRVGGQEVGEPEKGGRTSVRRFSFTALAGFSDGGPSTDFESGLILSGFDDDYFIDGYLFSANPRSFSENGGLEFELGYEYSKNFGLAASVGWTDLGVTTGFKADTDQGETGAFVHLANSARHISPALMYRRGPISTFLGPSFVQARTQMNHGLPDSQTKEALKVGVAAGIGLSAPLLWPALKLEFRARYRLVGDAEIGPFNGPDGGIPQFNANFSHWQAGIGLGLHLQGKGSVDPTVRPSLVQFDSVANAGMLAGKLAAKSRNTLGYTAGSLLGGLPIGIWSFCADQSDCLSITLGGAAIIGVTSAIALLHSTRTPKSFSRQLEGQDPRYADAFRGAYREELGGRHRRAILRGGITGVVVGLGLVLLLYPST